MKKRYWIVLICALLAVILAAAVASADTGDVYGLITDASELHDGDRIILVGEGESNYEAMAADFSGVQVTVSINSIIEQDGMLVLTMTETEGGWIFAADDGYLAVDGNVLAVVTDAADAAIWSIAIASDGTATITCASGNLIFAEQDGVYRFFCGIGGNEVAIYNATFELEHHLFGSGLWWTFANGKLTIGGSGAMPDYSDSTGVQPPWVSFCSEIIEVEIQDGVKSIGSWAFCDCTGLTSVTIGNSVADIGYAAFSGCTGLTSISLPDSMSSIGYYAFCDCMGLIEITIPNSVTEIDSSAFEGCTGLTSVTIGNGITSIDNAVFRGCTGLMSITMPCSARIDSSAFYGCMAITSVRLTVGTGMMVEYSYDTYQYTPWYISRSNALSVILDAGIQSIGTYAFSNCTGLTSITIPDSVTSVGGAAFSGCAGLTEITIPDSVTSIGGAAFSGCTGLTEIMIPDSVTSIGDSAFFDCMGLTSITIGNSVTSIGQHAFDWTGWWDEQNDGLVYLDYILLGVKGNCGQIVRIQDGTRLIAPSAFSYQTKITKVTIPDSVISIGSWAFEYCTGLTSITLPCSASIGRSAFFDCLAIASVHLTEGTGTMPSYSYCHNDTPWYISRNNALTITLDEGIQNIGDFAFYECTGLQSILIPDSVASLGSRAFYGCMGLTTITIDNGVTSIDWGAFYDCTSLTDVYYNGTRSDRARKLTISDAWNDSLLNATWHYLTEAVTGTVKWNAEDVQFKGTTAYVIANGSAQTPRFTVKNQYDLVIDPEFYDFEYRENTAAGTGYVIVTFKGDYSGTCRGFFKIYLPATTATTVENVSNGIKLTWEPVEGAAGYVVYRRAWNKTATGWTDFVRWNNTTELTWIDTTVYAGTRYQYGIKAYFAQRVDPVTGATIGGNVGDNFNLGEVGPLKTTVRITTRTLNSVTAGTKQMTVKWTASSLFTGYQIRYATNKTFTKNVKTIKITNPKTAQKVIKSLKTGTTYYVQIRSYHEFNSTTYYGEWSNTKSCKVK